MKKSFLLVGLLVSFLSSAFSGDVFTGHWTFEIIGTSETWQLLRDDSGAQMVINGMAIKQNLTIDEDEKTVIIPGLNGIADKFYYMVNDDGTIDLTVCGSYNIDLSQGIVNAITAEGAPNSVTADAYRVLAEKISELFRQIPILRLRRI